MPTPELLAPAGNLEKLKMAVLYGADAVYLGGQKFGLRAAADNFSPDEIVEGVEFAHARGTKVYVALNSFFHDEDFDSLPEFIAFLKEQSVDAVIVSDIGVVNEIVSLDGPEVHLSTQASCMNVESARFWKKQGVKRIVLGRECSLQEAKRIKEIVDIEIEMFIHGSMCMSYSGNCVISNFTQGRDSNRGGCAHSCRFDYKLSKGDLKTEEDKTAYFMSSKDLEGIRALPDFYNAEIDSLKVEGRMKSNHYVGTVTKVYANAIAHYKKEKNIISDDFLYWESELQKITHRKYTQASLYEVAGEDSIYDERETEAQEYVVIGVIQEILDKEVALVEIRSAHNAGEDIEIVPFKEKEIIISDAVFTDFENNRIERTKPGTLAKIPYQNGMEKYNIIRKRLRS